MQLEDIVHRVLPVIGPLAFFVAVTNQRRTSRSAELLVCALSLAVTLLASAASAWLGLRFDTSHELPDWYRELYWWSTQWIAPLGYAVAGLSFLAFCLRKTGPRGSA